MPFGADPRRRRIVGAVTAFAAAAMALPSCGVGGEPVDARVLPSSVAADSAGVAGVETTDCPAWATDVLTSLPADSGSDEDAWRQHFLDRSALLGEIAEQLPADDAALIDAYADAVREFGNEPMSPGASRQMGEAAADAAAVATRSC